MAILQFIDRHDDPSLRQETFQATFLGSLRDSGRVFLPAPWQWFTISRSGEVSPVPSVSNCLQSVPFIYVTAPSRIQLYSVSSAQDL